MLRLLGNIYGHLDPPKKKLYVYKFYNNPAIYLFVTDTKRITLYSNGIISYKSYTDQNFNIIYRRLKSGLELDFILGDAEIVIEIESLNR